MTDIHESPELFDCDGCRLIGILHHAAMQSDVGAVLLIAQEIERDAAERGVTTAKIRDSYERQASLRTFIDADDVAAMAFFLASEAAAKISGQAIAVDGNTETLASWLD